MKNKAVVFDMDGVIFDSERLMFLEWLDMAVKYGIKNMEKVYPLCIGTNKEKGRQILLDAYGRDFPYDRFRDDAYAVFHSKYDNGRLPLKKGVVELLSFLKDNGYFIAIASSSETSIVKSELTDAGIISYFDRVIGGDMVLSSKPAPDIFLKAVEGLSVNLSETYVVEDSFNGIRAANSAMMIPIMVPDMLKPDAEIRRLTAYICDDLLQVKDLLMHK